ncbi:MAG: ATP-binding protein [Carnobacterium sp.]
MAQGISDEPKENVVKLSNKKILKTAAIYGANSSGKSNFIKALSQMTDNVLSSVKLNDNESVDYDPFKLAIGNSNKPSFFEVIFLDENIKYRYGFELTSESILGEWLFQSKITAKSEKTLFIRTEEGIGVDEKSFPEGVGKEVNTNNNRLFLSLCAQLGGVESKKVISWFQDKINVISGIESFKYSGFTKQMLHKESEDCSKAKRFFKTMQLGFSDIEATEVEFDISQLPDGLTDDLKKRLETRFKGRKNIELKSKHFIYDKNGNIVGVEAFDVEEMESEGTQKLIQLSGPVFDTLANSQVLVVDELDAKMHPLISQYIIGLFNNPKTNPNNAQLIFTTHDTHLLSSKLLRRDQIWFTEKDFTEQTDLYNMMDISLPDGSKPRNDANYEKNYIVGRYGAIPYILNE